MTASGTAQLRAKALWLLPLLYLCMAAGAWFRGWPWIVFVAASLLATGLVCLLAWRKVEFTWKQVLLVALVGRAAMFTVPPGLSEDVFRYLWDGYLQHEGVNPFALRPLDPALEKYREESLYLASVHRRFYLEGHRQEHYRPEGGMNCAKQYSVYPPITQMVLRVAGEVYARAGFWWANYAVKLLFGLCELAALLLLLRYVGLGPATLLYAWNPLVMTEAWGQPHSEAVALPFLVLACLASRRGRMILATASITVAGWAKLYPLLFLPLLVRRGLGWRKIAGMVAISWAVTLLAWWPYWQANVLANIRETLHLYVSHYEYNGGLYYALKAIFGLFAGSILRYVFLAFTLAICYWRFRTDAPWEPAALAIMALSHICATTVHPWYFLIPLLLMALGRSPPVWFLLAFAALCTPTYLFYIYGWTYWPMVWLCWLVWPAVAFWHYCDPALQGILRCRSQAKARLMEKVLGRPLASGQRVLDFGAAEGYVGEWFQKNRGAAVALADIVDLNRTALPLHCYGQRLPFADQSFDCVICCYSLHHCADTEHALREVLRVSSATVLVMESTYCGPCELTVLRWVDRVANRLRSGRASPAPAQFRRPEEWRDLATRCGARMSAEWTGLALGHRTVVFCLKIH